MALEDIFNRFNENLNMLRSSKNVIIHYCEIHPPVFEEVFDDLEGKGVSLPEALKEFYLACNGLNLSWSYSEKEEGFTIYGWFNIMPLEYLMSGDTGDMEDIDNPDSFMDVLWNDFTDPKQMALRKELKVFEPVEGDNSFVCLNLKADPLIWYVGDFDLQPVSMSLEKYLGLLVDTMGVDVFRQMALQEEAFDQREFDYNVVQKMEEVFPWFNFNNLQEKYFDE